LREILTPRERFGLLVIDEQPDRCNIMPLVTSHAAQIKGTKLKDYYTNGEAMARAQITAYELYGHDAISIFSEVGIIAEAMGSEFSYPDNDLPVLKTPALSKVGVEEITIPKTTKAGRLSLYIEAIEYAYEALGDRVPILAYVPAPFTTGMMLSDPNEFLLKTIRDGPHIKRVMEKSLAAAIEFCYDIIDAGGLPVIVDPLASSSVISPKAYEEFAMPYERMLIDFLHRYDLDVILHICGETTPILGLLPNTNADLVSLDRVSLSSAVDALSNEIRIIGNLDTSNLAFSKPDVVSKAVTQMVGVGKNAPKGYIVSTGCEVPIQTPVENVKAFMKAAREVTWYWG
jgi:uroporphyrinogen decarboxylase